MLDLEPIKARIEAATPGPWTWDHPEADGGLVSETKMDGETSDLDGRRVIYPAVVLDSGPEHGCDGDLIAHAPVDLSALVVEVERLRAVEAAARVLMHEIDNGHINGKLDELEVAEDALRSLLVRREGPTDG